MFFLVAFFEGFGQGLIFTALTLLLADVAHPSVMEAAIGVNRTFMDIGGVVGPLVFILVYDSFIPQVSFILGLAITIVNLALMLLIRTKSARDE
jgi:predicted MFS family arabinose efflux permease